MKTWPLPIVYNMEKQKKSNSGGEEAKSFTRQKIIGTNSLQIGEDEASGSGLVGCIVEKGVSEKPLTNPTSISFPKPSVLPFPVARHRSHGPVSAAPFFLQLLLLPFLTVIVGLQHLDNEK